MMGHKICFSEEIWPIIPKLSLLLLLIWSPVNAHQKHKFVYILYKQCCKFTEVCDILLFIIFMVNVNAPSNISANLGPVVQSIVSLMSSLRGQLLKCFATL